MKTFLKIMGAVLACLGVSHTIPTTAQGAANIAPAGFSAIFNGKDLAGWWGATTEDPRQWMALAPDALAAKKSKSLEDIRAHWSVQNGELVNDGHGLYLTTDKNYRDFELWIDYKTVPKADSGIYLKGIPQVQIWDSTEEGKFSIGADKGSGGLWNNSPGAAGKDPLVLADKPLGQWNTFRIIQVGSRTSIWLNDKLVVDRAMMENYFDRKQPLPVEGPIQLQTHGGEIRWRNVFVRAIPSEEANRWLRAKDPAGFKTVFDGTNLEGGWTGAVDSYEIQDGALTCRKGKGGVIHTRDEYRDFRVRFEFKVPPGGNNGLAIRYPGSGDTAYVGMCELQVLDDQYEQATRSKLDPRQTHGSAYGMVAAHRGYQRPVGEWNYQEVTVKGSTIQVEMNGAMILNADLSQVTEFMADRPHPGKDRASGFFGFAGHGDSVMFRHVAIQRLD